MTTLEPLPPSDVREPVGAPSAPRILVVDDEVTIRYVLARHLARAGYRVDSAVDAEAAWAALRARPYDLLITDYSLPGPNGFELVARVRDAHAGLPVFLISGVVEAGDLERHRGLNFAAVFRKPFSLDGILEEVGRTIGAGRALPGTADLETTPADPFGRWCTWQAGGLNE